MKFVYEIKLIANKNTRVSLKWSRLPGARPMKLKSFIIIVLESTRTTEDADSPFFPRSVWGKVWGLGIFSLILWSTITRLYNAWDKEM